MKKIIQSGLVFLLLISSVLATGSAREDFRIKTDAYEEDLVYIDGTPIEGNVYVNLMIKERCNGFCKFRPYIFGSNRIRVYGILNGKRVSYEFKRIKGNPTFSEDYFELDGNADVYVEYDENKDYPRRSVVYNVPVELEYNKLSKTLDVKSDLVWITGINV